MKHIINLVFTLIIFSNKACQSPYIKEKITSQALYAIKKDSITDLKEAFSKGAHIEYKDKDGNNLLLIAVIHNAFESTNYLLKKEYFIKQIDAQNNVGRSALHCATNNQNPFIVTSLIHAGADSTIRNKRNATIAFCSHTINRDKLSPDVLKKIMLAKDENNNTHLHLLAMADIKSMARLSRKNTKSMLIIILDNLITAGVSLWDSNHHNEWPVETAYKTYQYYQELYNTEKTLHSKNKLNTQEKILHAFLLYYIKLEKGNAIPVTHLFTKELNIESTIALTYEHRSDYYKKSIEARNREKDSLRNTKIPQIWKSKSQESLNL